MCARAESASSVILPSRTFFLDRRSAIGEGAEMSKVPSRKARLAHAAQLSVFTRQA